MKRSLLGLDAALPAILLTPFFLFADVKNTPPETPIPESTLKDFKPNAFLTLKPEPLPVPVRLDGVVDAEWPKNARFGNFTEYQPAENLPPKAQTEGYVAFDSTALYVAFVCRDPDVSQLRASLSDRDQMLQDDWIAVSIDPNRDSQRAYQFLVNPRGIQGDMLFQGNGIQEPAFDLVWQSEARIFEDRWSVEMKIPFSSLRFPNRDMQNWGVHFTRNYPRDNLYKYSWMPITRNNNSFMGQAGALEFRIPRAGAKKQNLEFMPYTIANTQKYRDGDPESSTFGSWRSRSPEARAGFGIKYGISSDFIADAAYNPDFSQIESDAGQISLNNPFALFFDEKRPFFQEGADMYVVDQFTPGIALDQYVNLFYSRSIQNPLVAGKLTGKAGRWNLGYTSGYDQNTPYILPFEENSSVFTTDLKSFSQIARAKMDFGEQSSVGFFASDRRVDGNRGSNTVAAVNSSLRLSKAYTFSGIAAFTSTREPDDALLSQQIRPLTFMAGGRQRTSAFDGESFNGLLLRAKLQRDSRHLSAAAAYQDFSPGFRSENGFIISNGYRMIETMARYAFRFDTHPVFSSIEPRVNVWRKYNYNRIVKDTGVMTNVQIQLRRQTTVSVSAFVFNRENLRGRQFGDARKVWGFIQNSMSNSLTGFLFLSSGNEINRMGREGDPRNPFEIVPGSMIDVGVTAKPSAKINNSVEYQDYRLWKTRGGETLMTQKILRNSLSFQFSRSLFVRLIGEYNVANYYSSYARQMVRERYFTLDPLVSFKLNAFSVFYLGGHLGARDNVTLDWPDIRPDEQTLYAKLQYLLTV